MERADQAGFHQTRRDQPDASIVCFRIAWHGGVRGESAEPVREAPNPPLTMALALLGGAGIAIVAGALLIGWGRGWPAKWAGVALVASGFTANGIVFKDAKFGDLFRFDTRIDKVALELEIDRKLKALSEFGPEQLGVVDNFESGRADVRPHMGETIRAVCDKWRAHGDAVSMGCCW